MRALGIALLAAAALTDGPPSVTARVVSDATGDAIPNARVRVAADGGSTLAVTDAEGRFAIPQSSAPVTVTAAKSGYVSREITVRPAQPAVELRLVRAAVISGRVVTRQGDPIVDARVSAERPATGASQIVVSTQTDDAGEFRLAGLAAGSFVVAVTTMSVAGQRHVEAGAVHYDSEVMKTYYPEAATVDEAEVIAVTAGEEHPNADIVVAPTQIGGLPFGLTAVRRIASPSRSDESAAIAGRVSTPDGRPLARAVVRLIGAFAPAPDQSTTTDADGRYAFEGLAPGTYRIAASKSGYAPLNPSDVVLPPLPMLGSGPSITVDHDQKRNDVDVTLAHLATVSGFVFDEIGEPIQGATIQLQRVRFERGRRRLVPAGAARSTDDRGHYRIFDVEPGRYLVTASIGALMVFAGGTTDLPGYAPTYFPGTTDPRMAQFVAVTTSQDVISIDLSLAPTKTALVSGTIVTAAGEPTMAGTLQLRQVVGASASPVPMNAKTRNDGVFAFENVPPGSYLIYADRGRTNPSTEGEFITQPVTVTGDGDVTGLKLQMSSGSTISGRITFDTSDPDRRPDASRVEISPVPVDVDRSPGTPANADIARDWTFQMRGINGVRRLLAPRLPAGWALREVRVNGVDATDRPIPFGRRDDSVSDVEVVLTDRVATAAGIVTDSDGHPVPDAVVLAFAVDRDQRYPWSRVVQRTTSARDGTFTLASILGGSYYVAAVSAVPLAGDDAWQDTTFLESLVPSAAMMSVSDGERRTINLRVR